MTLVGARVAVDAASSKFADLVIRDGRIHFAATAPRDSQTTFDLWAICSCRASLMPTIILR